MLKISERLAQTILDSGLHCLTQDWNLALRSENGTVLALFPTKGMFHFKILRGDKEMFLPKPMRVTAKKSGTAMSFKLYNVGKPDVWLTGECGTMEHNKNAEMIFDVLQIRRGEPTWIDTFKIWL